MHVKTTFWICLFLLIGFAGNSQSINWMTIEQAQLAAQEKPKPIFIDTYTDWCGWCKRLDVITFKDPQVVQYLNQNFYPVKYDAESSDTIVFKDKVYTNKMPGRSRSTHDLTYELFGPGSRISYPTMLLFDHEFNHPLKIPGFQQANELLPFLVFYGEQQYKGGANPSEFAYFFKAAFEQDTTGWFDGAPAINWLPLPAAFAAAEADTTKKIFVQIVSPNSVTCRVVDSTNFSNPAINAYINEHYYPVKFNAFSDEVFELNGYEFKRNENSVHDFVASLIPKGQSMTLPCFLVFENSTKLVDRSSRYMAPQFMEVYLVYLAEEIDKPGANFQSFYKQFQSKIK